MAQFVTRSVLLPKSLPVSGQTLCPRASQFSIDLRSYVCPAKPCSYLSAA